MPNALISLPQIDLQVGQLTPQGFNAPRGCIADAAVATAAAGQGIQAAKLQQQRIHEYTNGATNTNALAETRRIRTVKGQTGAIVEFAVGAETPLTGNDTCTVDLQKNGTSVLVGGPIALAAGDTAGALKAAAGYISTALIANDVLRIVVTPGHNAGTLPQGVFARLTFTEDAQ